jgi:hypothetical protein
MNLNVITSIGRPRDEIAFSNWEPPLSINFSTEIQPFREYSNKSKENKEKQKEIEFNAHR